MIIRVRSNSLSLFSTFRNYVRMLKVVMTSSFLRFRFSILFNVMTCTVLIYLISNSRKFKNHVMEAEKVEYRVVESFQNLSANRVLDLQNVTSQQKRTVYVITPTYERASQQPDLTRFAQTLMNVNNIHWIIIEDAEKPTEFVTSLLSRMPFPHTHLIATMTDQGRRR